MKLLNCIACQDILRLYKEERSCRCGKSSGRYINSRKVEYSGPSRIIGLKSLDYHKAESGVEYTWIFIPHDSESLIKI